MTPPVSEPTLDLGSGTRVNAVRDRYDTAWQESLMSGGPPPDRESFLTECGDSRAELTLVLDTIDTAYLRLRELVRSGAVTVTRHPGAGATRPTQHGETIESVEAAAGTEPDLRPLGEGVVIGSYELLGVLAHGGMGVVYKARHTRLDRFAAIKMVLAGAHASTDQLLRFRSEAQVVARLQHPNVVQLYEVGEHDGLPYIALEFVEGGSLAHKAGGRPQPPREAAGAIETLARATEYAHQHGIIHRDLKPANVLLTGEGVPKITDFGLAKRLEADSGQTRTGTLMGTPSYMAPEQARGDLKAVGPLTDVYALGAVLYELLTGVPPFAAATPLETVVAVQKKEPVPPSRLQPRVPRDLETICLKCLEKDPARRFASAAELAADLRRFLAGEPIHARRVSRAERLWRWCRRHPDIAALSAVVLLLLSTVAAGSTAAAFRIRAEKRIAEENAVAARDAQGRAESALGEAKHQKALAEQSATDARAAQTQAETAKAATEKALKQTEIARTEAEKARQRADEQATLAAAQRELALDALGGLATKVQDQLDDAPGTQGLKKELLELAVGGLQRIARSSELAGVADIRMAEGHRRLGELAFRLGEIDLARRNFEQVERIVRAQADANPDDPTWRRSLSVAQAKLGDLCAATGDRPGARKHYEVARKLRAELSAAAPTSAAATVDLAQVYVKLGDVSDPEPAVKLYLESLRLRRAVLAADTGDPNARRDVRISHYKLADGHLKRGDVDAARVNAEKSLEFAEALFADFPKTPQLQQDLALSRGKLGDVFRAEQKPEARKEYAEAVRLLEPLAAENPRDLVLQVTYAVFLAHAGKHAEAAAAGGRVREQAPKNAFLLYNAACVYALCAEAAAEGKSPADLSAEERKRLAGYGETAIACLKAALAVGFADYDLIRTDPELAAIRQLPAYAELAKGLR
jgi:tRNA A-37 threonylcarbamoyl transferase component Bud32/tetratricopeptide (TPR) repeat protein